MYVRAVHTVKEIREALEPRRKPGKAIALVPTMGALHIGHEKLIEMARTECELSVVSIFVNPLQFGPNEDYERYPRTFPDDIEICRRHGVDFVFAPAAGEMYPLPQLTFAEVTRLSNHLCGSFRPGHFRAVATVVLKLFNIVQPQRAYFGEKDMQQLAVVRRMTADLNLPITIVPVPTVREADGLAVSSRNRYLDPGQRKVAPLLYRALKEGEKRIRSGEKDAAKIRADALRVLDETPLVRVDYLEVVDPDEIQPVRIVTPPVRIAGAVWVGTTRLIDNVLVGT
ncbi:MAG: pantoate--beta-alanine ligase [Acidobacteria bacterium]|nr:MAG: pantoate--beta-alanine ligase [Acidobacteriota bacterium]